MEPMSWPRYSRERTGRMSAVSTSRKSKWIFATMLPFGRSSTGRGVVFHIAALYRFWSPDPDEFYDVNVGGTVNVMSAAREAGCERVVYTSTVGTVGLDGTESGRPADERDWPRIEHLFGSYKRSKYVAEHEVLRVAAEGLPVVLVQPTLPSGRVIEPRRRQEGPFSTS